jgi:hypothetical protein
MPQTGLIYRALVASPSDCQDERAAIPEVLQEWNAAHSLTRRACILPMRWELDAYPALSDRPQALLNKQLVNRCDLLIGTFWTRIGSPTGVARSGTAEEIAEFRDAGKPILLYFSSAPIEPQQLDAAQFQALTEYRAELAPQGLFFTYSSIGQLRTLLAVHLTRTLAELAVDPTMQISASDDDLECSYDWYNEIGYKDTSELVPTTRVLYQENAMFPDLDEQYYEQLRRIRIPTVPFAVSPRGFVKVAPQDDFWLDPRKRDRRIYQTTLRDPVDLSQSCIVDILPPDLDTGGP